MYSLIVIFLKLTGLPICTLAKVKNIQAMSCPHIEKSAKDNMFGYLFLLHIIYELKIVIIIWLQSNAYLLILSIRIKMLICSHNW